MLLYYASPAPRWAHFAVTLSFDAVTYILREVAEYVTFIRNNPNEFKTACTDTTGDLRLSLAGSVTVAILTVTVLHMAGQVLRASRT